MEVDSVGGAVETGLAQCLFVVKDMELALLTVEVNRSSVKVADHVIDSG